MSLNEKFNTAADKVRHFTKKPEEKDLLELYSLYKQSIVGDCNTPKPTEAQAKAKWDAWNAKKGISQDAAKNAYVTRANILLPKYA